MIHSEPPFLAQVPTVMLAHLFMGKQLGGVLRKETCVSMEQIPSLANEISMQALVWAHLRDAGVEE